MAHTPTDTRFVFFGTPENAALVLEELHKKGYTPALVVTAPDKPVGRKQIITPPPVKVWAEEHFIDVLQPESLKDEMVFDELANTEWDVFIVAAYGGLIPKEILDLPQHGTLNIHPSLLPKFRGPSPVRSAILSDEKETGVSIMLLDEEMDHGPVIGQASIAPEEWPPKGSVLEQLLFNEGSKLLIEALPLWFKGELTEEDQDHTKATFSKKITKADGEIDLADDPYQNFLKIQAFDDWPGTFFFVRKDGKETRVKVTEASYKDGTLTIERVIPEGKKEMDYDVFQKSLE